MTIDQHRARAPRWRSAPADEPADNLDGFKQAADGTLKGTTDFTFAKPVTARFVLVWITGLVPSDNGFSADIAEVAVHAAG